MKEFKKYLALHATPEDIYNALVNPVMLDFGQVSLRYVGRTRK